MLLLKLITCVLLENVTPSPFEESRDGLHWNSAGQLISDYSYFGASNVTRSAMLHRKLIMDVLGMADLWDLRVHCSIRGALRLVAKKIEKDILPGMTIVIRQIDSSCMADIGVEQIRNHFAKAQYNFPPDVIIGEHCR